MNADLEKKIREALANPKNLGEMPDAELRRTNVLGKRCRRRRVHGRGRELVQNLVEEFARCFMRESQRDNPLGLRSKREQTHEAIRERVGFSRPR